MKKSHIKDKKKQVINDRQAALEKDVRAVMYIIGFRRLSGDQQSYMFPNPRSIKMHSDGLQLALLGVHTPAGGTTTNPIA